MRKFLTLAVVASCLLSCGGKKSADGMVYLCTGLSAETFHEDDDCKGLNMCRGDVVKVSVKEAFDAGRRPCHMCCDENYYALERREDDMSGNLGKYIYKDAFTLHTKMNCVSSDVKFLDTCDVYLDDVYTNYCTNCFNDAKYEHLMRIAKRNGWR